MVRALGWKVPPKGGAGGGDARTAYFIPSPGEQHTFGLFIVEDYFRRAGWRTWLETSSSEREAAEMVSQHWFDVFGMSADRDSHLPTISSVIARVRRESRNPDLFVMVGGRLFVDHPELVQQVGADGTAATGRDALLIADKAVRRHAAAN